MLPGTLMGELLLLRPQESQLSIIKAMDYGYQKLYSVFIQTDILLAS